MTAQTSAAVAGLILTLLGVIVGIVAMATDHWADFTRNEITVSLGQKIKGHRGLIKHCLGDSCTRYETYDGRVDGMYIQLFSTTRVEVVI